MIFFVILLFSLNIYNKTAYNKAKQYYYSGQGYRKIQIQNQDSITMLFDGLYHGFFFMNYNLGMKIESIYIDGVYTDFYSTYNIVAGLALDGEFNATIKFTSDPSHSSDISISADLWIIPKEMCTHSTGFISGGYSQEVNYDDTYFCLFSTGLDTKKTQYTVKTQIKHHNSSMSFYTTNFNEPDFKTNSNELKTIEIKKPYFSEFHFSNEPLSKNGLDSNFNAYYKRIPKKNNIFGINNDYCVNDPVTRCVENLCKKDSFLWSAAVCESFDRKAVIIFSVVVGSALIIVIVLLFVLCLRKKKDNGQLNNAPLNSINENLNQNQNDNIQDQKNNQNNYYN